MLSLAQPNFTSLTQSHTLYFVHFLAYVISVISHMCRIPQPQHYKAAAGENGDFVFALISKRLKLHSWNFRFRKLTYDINGKMCHISAMGVYGTGRTSVAKTCPHNGKRKSQNFLCILKNWARCNLENPFFLIFKVKLVFWAPKDPLLSTLHVDPWKKLFLGGGATSMWDFVCLLVCISVA